MCAAGPERRKLKIKDAERYGWQPKEMLAQIASIYIHLGQADGQANPNVVARQASRSVFLLR